MIQIDLGHKQYTSDEIRLMEKQILKNIGFSIPTSTLHERAYLKFKEFLEFDNPHPFKKSEVQKIEQNILFLCKMIAYYVEFAFEN